MPDHHPVPDRVRDGSTNIIRDLDDWQRVHAESMANPDAFWLEQTAQLIAWEK